MFSAREIIDIALKIEQNGEAVYRQAVKYLDSPELAERLLWMADEEARHMAWFKKFQANLADDGNRLAANEMSSSALGDILGDQSFTLQDIDFSQVGDISKLIDIFIEFERDGILFYEMLRTFIKDPGALDPLDQGAHVDVVRLLGSLGRAKEASDQARRCRQILDVELGMTPGPELEAALRLRIEPQPAAPGFAQLVRRAEGGDRPLR